MVDWKRYACAALSVGKFYQMLATGFFDVFPSPIREEEIQYSKRVVEEIYVEFPGLRRMMEAT